MSGKDFAGIKDTDLVPAALTGYRQWRTDLSGALRSVSYDYTWSKAESATCREIERTGGWLYGHSDEKHPAQIPADQCGCGIYGWYQPDHSYQRHSGDVLGVVKVQGLTLMGTHGFRTQKAEVVAVSRPKGLETGEGSTPEERARISVDRVLRWEADVQSRYPGIEVYSSPAELIMAHPPNDVSNLIGEQPPISAYEGIPSVIAAFYNLYDRNFAITRWHWLDVLAKMNELRREFPNKSPEFNAYLDKIQPNKQVEGHH